MERNEKRNEIAFFNGMEKDCQSRSIWIPFRSKKAISFNLAHAYNQP